ncbi:hypothetical protein ScPMuIL_005532 [Solemya velum]
MDPALFTAILNHLNKVIKMVSTEALISMKSMAADPVKRMFLAKDATCVGGLVLVLSNSNTEVIKLALETLLLLAESQENHAVLKNFLGMLDQLETILKSQHSDTVVRHLAESLYLQITQTPTHTPLKDSFNNHSERSYQSSCQKKLTNSKHKHIVMQIRGIADKHDRDFCMKLLIQTKGVVSITFDSSKKRCILRTKMDTKPETLVQAVARSMTMTARQVVKDEMGNELLLSFGNNTEDLDKENLTLPDYLPEEAHSPVVGPKAVARNSADQSNKGWFSSAATFLSKTLYW